MNELLSWLLIISIVMALLHYVYGSIIAPSWRQNLRFKLFALRDELRQLKQSDSRISDQAFALLDEGISRQILFQHQLTPSLAYKLQEEEKNNQELKVSIQSELEEMRRSKSEDYARIQKQAGHYLLDAFFCNGLIWYLIPALCLLLGLAGCSWFTKIINSVLLAPRNRFEELSATQSA